MNKLPYKLSSDYKKLKELLYNKYEIVCFLNGKVGIGRRKGRKYVFYVDSLCLCNFSIDCADMTFAETIAEYKVKFILPSDIANIFDSYFKVKIHNREEFKKVVEHLRGAGFHELKDEFDELSDVYGIAVGRAKFVILNNEDVFRENRNSELSVDEVLKMSFR